MQDQFSRTRMLLGSGAMEYLSACRVAVFGLGGVGGYVVEALARSGIGAMDLIDNDRISVTNLNRQLLATVSTIGQYKTEAAERRVHEINPACRVKTYTVFYLPETQKLFDFSEYDYVVDAIDTVRGKLALAEQAQAAGVPVISAMGAGNKLDPSALRVAEIGQTSVCPLARIMRKECRKRGIDHLKVVYSTEPPTVPVEKPADTGAAEPEENVPRRDTPGSAAFVPAAAGLMIAGEVIRDLCSRYRELR